MSLYLRLLKALTALYRRISIRSLVVCRRGCTVVILSVLHTILTVGVSRGIATTRSIFTSACIGLVYILVTCLVLYVTSTLDQVKQKSGAKHG